MWERENKHIGLKIFLVVLILAMCGGLFIAYRYVKAEEAVHDAELLEVYNEHQREQNAARQANYETLEALYREDVKAVATYLPGIVCWGDTLTAGSAGGVSYPGTLQDLIDANIVDRYDFRGTLENTEGLARIEDWSVYSVDIPVVNMGSGQETSATVAGRNGAIPFVVSEEFTIPAEATPVSIKFKSQDGSAVTPLTQGNAGVNNVTINGIEGTLAIDLDSYSSRKYNYIFTRLNPGEETLIEPDTEIVTAASSMYRDYITVLYLGTYDNQYSTVDELISYQKAIIDHQTANKDRYIILGLYYMNTRWDNGTTSDLDTYEAAMLKEYGDHFINVRKYMCSDGLADAGLSPTNQDTNDIKHGLVPSSLRSSADPSELNATGYKLLGQLVYDRMDKLEYFKEVKDELGITQLEKQDRQNSVKTK